MALRPLIVALLRWGLASLVVAVLLRVLLALDARPQFIGGALADGMLGFLVLMLGGAADPAHADHILPGAGDRA